MTENMNNALKKPGRLNFIADLIADGIMIRVEYVETPQRAGVCPDLDGTLRANAARCVR
jgi:hypothetical protein